MPLRHAFSFVRPALIAGLSLLPGLPWSAFAQQGDAAGRVHAFEQGRWRAAVLGDGRIDMGPAWPFVGADTDEATVMRAAREAGTPEAVFDINVLLLRDGESVVLVDAGYGPYSSGGDSGYGTEALLRAGTRPEDVTDVLVTHGHVDHVGGLVTAEGRPRFANATVHVTRAELEFWQDEPDLSRMQIPADFRTTLVRQSKEVFDALDGRLAFVEPGAEVLPGIRARALPGHTPGHTGYLVDGDVPLFWIGDVVHVRELQLARPDWLDGADIAPEKGVRTRGALLAELAGDEVRVGAPHLPFPGLGTLRAADGGGTAYRFVPEP